MSRKKKYFTEEEFKFAAYLRNKKRRLENSDAVKEYQKTWHKENKEYTKQKAKEYRQNNKEEINRKAREWRSKNKDKTKQYSIKERSKNRHKNNPLVKFRRNSRALVKNSFNRMKKGYKKTKKTEKILGCSLDFFLKYILDKCPEGVTVNDFGRYGYHIDHKIPLASANNQEETEKLCHYTNLQPLWWEDNLSKSNKILSL